MHLPFEFECKIYPKPKGNWRPRVDLKIVIKKENYPWRPYLRNICIITECGGCSNSGCDQRFALPEKYLQNKTLPSGSLFIYLPSSPFDGAIGGLFEIPKKGDTKRPFSGSWFHKCSTVDNEKIRFSYYYLISKKYLDEDININLSFYLPWLPGENPDYTEYAQRLAEIPALLEECLKDGLDSGESSEIIITRGQIISNVLNNENKAKKIRKLNL